MSFSIVMGLISIVMILFASLIYMLINEVHQAHFSMKGEVLNHLLESAVDESVMYIRQEMNNHKGMQMGTWYGHFRSGAGNSGDAPAAGCPLTIAMAKKYYDIPEKDINVTADFILRSSFNKDMMGEDRQVPATSKGVSGILRVVAEVAYKDYKRRIEVRKDVKVVRVLPPYPDFSLVVRDGGHANANYNKWVSYEGGEIKNFTVLSGDDPDAAKNGKILFGGGIGREELKKLIPDPYPKTDTSVEFWMAGFIPSPDASQFATLGLKQKPIILNLTNYGNNNKEVSHLYDNSIQSISEYQGMLPTSDFHAFGSQQNNFGALMGSILPNDVDIPVVKSTGSGTSTTTKTDEVSLTFYKTFLGYGKELAEGPHDVIPKGFFGGKKAPGYLNYFKKYQETYAGSIFDITGSGMDLLGSDPTDTRDHGKRPNRTTQIYGNVMGSFVNAMAMKINSKDAKAAALPWVNFQGKQGAAEADVLKAAPYKGHLPKEYKRSLAGNVLNKMWNTVKLNLREAAKSGLPVFGKEESAEYTVEIPEALYQPFNLGAVQTIWYRYVMSSPKYFPLDPEMFNASQSPGQQYYGKMIFRDQYVSPLTGATYNAAEFNEQIPPELFDLSPDMASYKFIGPMEFILHLQDLGYLTFDDKSGVHDLYLDGIWFVQGLISDFRYQSLPLPPPSNTTQEQYSLPGVMRVHGKGMIATVEGTEISLGGVVEAGDESATQLSVVVAPTRILFNLLNIFRTNPELIPPGMTLSGNINVTDRPAQASVCTPMGGIVFQDDPTWNRQAAEATYGKNAPYDRFYIIGNLIVNQLNQEQMESKATNGRSLGGGVVRYDNHLIEDSFGQADNKNYHVTIGQRFSYYDITVVNDDLKEDGRVN